MLFIMDFVREWFQFAVLFVDIGLRGLTYLVNFSLDTDGQERLDEIGHPTPRSTVPKDQSTCFVCVEEYSQLDEAWQLNCDRIIGAQCALGLIDHHEHTQSEQGHETFYSTPLKCPECHARCQNPFLSWTSDQSTPNLDWLLIATVITAVCVLPSRGDPLVLGLMAVFTHKWRVRLKAPPAYPKRTVRANGGFTAMSNREFNSRLNCREATIRAVQLYSARGTSSEQTQQHNQITVTPELCRGLEVAAMVYSLGYMHVGPLVKTATCQAQKGEIRSTS